MKVLSVSANVVGCVLGVGFLTGKEIAVFFGGKNPLFVSVCFFILFFCLVFLFLSLGKRYGTCDISVINKNIFGKSGIFFDAVFVFTCFASVSAMMAGSQALFKMLFATNFPFSFFVALICGVGLCFDVKTIKRLNAIFVPVVVVLLFAMLFSSLKNGWVLKGNIAVTIKVVQYCSFNCMLGCAMFLSCGKNLSQGQRVLCSFISCAVLSLLVFVVLSAFNKVGGDLPVLHVARNNGFLPLYASVVFVGIYTSLCSCGYTVVSCVQKRLCDKIFSVALTFICAYVVSMFGFGKILSFILPVSSSFAVVFVVFVLITQVFKKQK